MSLYSVHDGQLCLVCDRVQIYLIFLWISPFLLFIDQRICYAMQKY